MNPHRYHVKINLKLEAVTCPGVWLCSHGYLEVTIKVLGYFFRTGAREPYFPLLCHEQFKMEGYFNNATTMISLLDNISKEQLEITLWQNSRRMAYYEGSLMDLLQYKEPKLQCPHINTRQLLMKTTPAFPGIIGPKVELTTHLFIKDKILNLYNTSEDLRKCANIYKRPRGNSKPFNVIKPIQYQKPCTIQTSKLENINNITGTRIRKQKTVCHTRDTKEFMKKLSDESFYAKPHGRRVSIASSCCSNNTHTSVGICDLEHDSRDKAFIDHSHEEFCELCRLYKEVFLV